MADIRYPQQYQEACFQAWYSAGRPTKLSKVIEIIPEVNGHKPNRYMVGRWISETWSLRADELDAKAIELADNHLIFEKAEMLKQQAERGKMLQTKGIDYLEEKGFDSSSSAVQAVIRGAELERTSRGIGELIVKMAKMSEGDLKEEIMKRLQILSDDTAIDAEVKEEDGTEEADESTD